ncbi:hypothetical protein D9M70_596670 [compost metagenome]
MLAASGFHAMHHGNRVGVADVGHQHADQAGTPAFQAARHLVRPVAEFGYRLLDALGRGLGEQGTVVTDETRDAGLGHLGVFGDVEHGDAAALGGGKVVHGLKPCYWIYRVSVRCEVALKPVS